MNLQEALAAVEQQRWLDHGLAPEEVAYSKLEEAAFVLARVVKALQEISDEMRQN